MLSKGEILTNIITSTSVDRRKSSRYQYRVMIVTLIISDIVMVSLSLLLAWYLRIGSGVLIYHSTTDISLYIRTAFLAAFVFVGIFALIGLYNQELLLGGTNEYGLVFQGCTYGMVALVMLSYIQRSQSLSRGWLLLSWIISIIILGAARFLLRRLFFRLRRSRGWFIKKTLIVGVSEHALAIARQLTNQSAGVDIVGFLDDFLPTGYRVLENFKVLGTPEQLYEITKIQNINQVILLSNAVTWETFQNIMAQSAHKNGFTLHISPGFYEIMTSNIQITHKAFVPLLRVETARIRGIDLVLKTALDYSLGFLLTLISLPVMVLITLGILVSSGWPPFTRNQVLGLAEETFWTCKFRTDLQDKVRRRLDEPLPLDDTRIADEGFPLGRFLFQTGLDKLPQLFAVFRGKLSLVGPRTNSHNQDYLNSGEFHPSLMTVKPGWTGPWAVGGAKTPQDELRLNLYYIRNWTIWLDLQILFQTFKLVMTRNSRN